MMKDEGGQSKKNHSIRIDDRSRMVITGVTDTDKFDENSVLLYTCMGEIRVRGKNLHVNGLSLENGEMLIEGEINSVVYGDSITGPLNLWGKLFR